MRGQSKANTVGAAIEKRSIGERTGWAQRLAVDSEGN